MGKEQIASNSGIAHSAERVYAENIWGFILKELSWLHYVLLPIILIASLQREERNKLWIKTQSQCSISLTASC